MNEKLLLLDLKILEKTLGFIISYDARRVIYFLSGKKVLRVTRRVVNKKFSREPEFCISLCKPNFKEREILKRQKGKISIIVEHLNGK